MGILAAASSPTPPKSRFFPVIFPVSREFNGETSSLETATTANITIELLQNQYVTHKLIFQLSNQLTVEVLHLMLLARSSSPQKRSLIDITWPRQQRLRLMEE
jgi:hypothetical protein